MSKYATHKGRDIPQVNIPDNLLAERRLQVIHGYFQWWIEALSETFGMEKAKELAIEWGRKKGIHTGSLYGRYFKKKGIGGKPATPTASVSALILGWSPTRKCQPLEVLGRP